MTIIRRSIMLTLAATLVAGLAACSDTPGQPVPQPNTTEQTSTSKPTSKATTSTKPTSSAGGLDKVDPCQLLVKADESRFQAEPGIPKDTSRSKACDWTVKGQGGFRIALRPDQGLDEIVVGDGKLSKYTVGSRDSRKLEASGGPGACMISIQVTESSRVDVDSTARSDTAKACEFATQVAELIEPKLPKGDR